MHMELEVVNKVGTIATINTVAHKRDDYTRETDADAGNTEASVVA